MPYHHHVLTQNLTAEAGGEVVFPPTDLSETPLRTITIHAEAGTDKIGLQSFDLQYGPTALGPWHSEPIGAYPVQNLAAGATVAIRQHLADRFMQCLARAADPDPGESTDLSVYVDAVLPSY